MNDVDPFRQGDFAALPELPKRAHAFFEHEELRVTTESPGLGTLTTSYREAGSGPTLLLVHGLMTTGYSFRYVLEPLAERFRVIVPDLPGAGRSDKPRGAYSPDAFVAWLDAFSRATDCRDGAVVGNSFGGYLCMRWALSDPRAMSRLVNIHSPGLPEPRLWALSAALSAPGAAWALDKMVARDPERWAHKNVHYYDEGLKSREEAREYGAPLRTPEGRAAFRGWLKEGLDPREMRRFVDQLLALKRIRQSFPVPLLFVYAEQDPMVPPRIGEKLASMVPDAKLEWLPKSSHFAHVDTPGPLVKMTLPFLSVRRS